MISVYKVKSLSQTGRLTLYFASLRHRHECVGLVNVAFWDRDWPVRIENPSGEVINYAWDLRRCFKPKIQGMSVTFDLGQG